MELAYVQKNILNQMQVLTAKEIVIKKPTEKDYITDRKPVKLDGIFRKTLMVVNHVQKGKKIIVRVEPLNQKPATRDYPNVPVHKKQIPITPDAKTKL